MENSEIEKEIETFTGYLNSRICHLTENQQSGLLGSVNLELSLDCVYFDSNEIEDVFAFELYKLILIEFHIDSFSTNVEPSVSLLP